MADKADNESTAGSQFRRNLCSIFRENKNIVFSLITTLSLSLIGLLLTVYVWPVHNWQVSKFLDSKEAGDRSTKHIAVVITKKSGTTFTIPEEFRKGFGDSPNFDTSTGQKIEFIREDDFLSPDQAKIIAHKLLENNNNVLIIGNSTSSLTEVTLNEILKYPDIKPGFLLPIATADNIIEKAKDQNFGSILRMMPNNDKQADTIKNFIFRKFNNKSPRIAIFSDEENTTYSHSLSQKIADKIIIEKGTVVLKKDYGNSNRLIDNIENLETYKQMPDVYVFVGISTNGSLFKEELKNLDIKIPVIFTDGCTVKDLMDKSKNNPDHYFLSAVNVTDNLESPTYSPIGEDARELAQLIIKGIDGNIGRESVAAYIEKLKNRGEVVLNGKAGKYQFDRDGDNIGMNWKIYNHQNGKLTSN